jgi:hypothetical protein
VITMPDVNRLFPRLDENAQYTARELIGKSPSPSRKLLGCIWAVIVRGGERR